MPKHRFERSEPTHDWQELRTLLTDPTQRTYEIIRPVILGWTTPRERAAETGMPQRTIYHKANLFDQAGMANHLPPSPPPAVPKLGKRSLPPPMHQAIVDLKTEYPPFTLHEIATICYAQFGRRPSPHTCGRILALNRELYHLHMPAHGGRPKKELPFKPERRHHYWFVDIRYLDMHTLGGGMIYCISILEGYSRAILASAVTHRQTFEEYVAVLYAAIRKHGCPEVIVSDHGGVFRDRRAMQIYTALGIEKKEIEKRQSWQNLIETAFNVQRRMGDWYFETAKSWEDLVAVHEKWVLDYNYQRHLAHEKREDGRHSPAEVLGWITGKQYEPDYMYRAFSALGVTRTLSKVGYACFRDFLLYGERNLAGEKVHINVFQETLAVEYDEQTLAKYSVEWQPDDEHLLRVGNPLLYDHSYQSSQLDLWPQDALEWFVIIKAVPYGSRPRRKRSTRILVIQSPLWTEEA